MEVVERSSRVHNFSHVSTGEKVETVAEFAHLGEQDRQTLDRLMRRRDSPAMEIAPNFRVNDKDYMVPMVLEEASVVPAASNGARLARNVSGFSAVYTGSMMEGQIYLERVKDIERAIDLVSAKKGRLLELANRDSKHVAASDVSFESIECRQGEKTLAISFLFDTHDAAGMNRINGGLENAVPEIEAIIGGDGKVNGSIITNFSHRRLVMAGVDIRAEDLGGEEVVERIVCLSELGNTYLKRAATENKGIMNGVVGVLQAMDNDTRAEEAAVHSYVAYRRRYRALTEWKMMNNGDLHGELVMPAQVAVTGGAVGLYDQSRIAKRILSRNDPDNFHVDEFACVAGSVGLANNLSALWKIASEGIQAGHMRLFAQQKAELDESLTQGPRH